MRGSKDWPGAVVSMGALTWVGNETETVMTLAAVKMAVGDVGMGVSVSMRAEFEAVMALVAVEMVGGGRGMQ